MPRLHANFDHKDKPKLILRSYAFGIEAIIIRE